MQIVVNLSFYFNEHFNDIRKYLFRALKKYILHQSGRFFSFLHRHFCQSKKIWLNIKTDFQHEFFPYLTNALLKLLIEYSNLKFETCNNQSPKNNIGRNVDFIKHYVNCKHRISILILLFLLFHIVFHIA